MPLQGELLGGDNRQTVDDRDLNVLGGCGPLVGGLEMDMTGRFARLIFCYGGRAVQADRNLPIEFTVLLCGDGVDGYHQLSRTSAGLDADCPGIALTRFRDEQIELGYPGVADLLQLSCRERLPELDIGGRNYPVRGQSASWDILHLLISRCEITAAGSSYSKEETVGLSRLKLRNLRAVQSTGCNRHFSRWLRLIVRRPGLFLTFLFTPSSVWPGGTHERALCILFQQRNTLLGPTVSVFQPVSLIRGFLLMFAWQSIH